MHLTYKEAVSIRETVKQGGTAIIQVAPAHAGATFFIVNHNENIVKK